jgi:hypothetical protein
MEIANDQNEIALKPPGYLVAICDYLQVGEPGVWEWFSANQTKVEHVERTRLELLKSAYRLDRGQQPELYRLAEAVTAALSLDCPVTFYQSQNSGEGMNAALAYIPGEIHMVMQGPIMTALNDVEKQALMGHEFSHYLLWERWDGRFLIASQILGAMTLDAQAEPAHLESARLFDMYCEIFCDQGALRVTEDLNAAIAMLVKIETGLQEVSAESYLAQAEEIFSKEDIKAAGISHPESFIRSRALKLCQESRAETDAEIKKMIEGTRPVSELDLLGQQRVMGCTRRLIESFLAEEWMQSEPVLAHARSYFSDFRAADNGNEVDLEAIKAAGEPLKEYYCYVLLDFVVADRDLEDVPLAAALLLARRLEMEKRFGTIAMKELNLKKSQFEKIEKNAEKLVAGASEMEKQA